MADLAGVIYTSHGPFTTLLPEEWDVRSRGRSFRSDNPFESMEEKRTKADRSQAGLEVLKGVLIRMRPDVLVIIGNDQFENYDFGNYPTTSVFVGEEFTGPDSTTRGNRQAYHHVPGHPALGQAILIGLMERGFDPAFSLSDSNPEKGMCHAIMRPLEFFGYDVPVVPMLVNTLFPPQITAKRCYALGRALREIIEAFSHPLRIAVIGSGGLWHTPGSEAAYVDETFDQGILNYLEKGDAWGMAEFFDGYQVAVGDPSQRQPPGSGGGTGLPTMSGPQLGTRETCSWIAAAAVVDRQPNHIVDYIPMYTCPIGTSFAYCDLVS